MNKRSEKRNKRKIEHWQVVTLYLLIYDYIAIVISYFGALWLRFDCQVNRIPEEYLSMFMRDIFIYGAICLVVFWCMRLYRSIWGVKYNRDNLRNHALIQQIVPKLCTTKAILQF